MYRIDDDLAAYSFNRAVMMFGLAVEQAMSEAAARTKTAEDAARVRKAILEQWLAKGEGHSGKSGFRDPAKAMSF